MPEHTGRPDTDEHVHGDRDDESPLASFSPDAIREHFLGTDRERQSNRLSDPALTEAADHILLTNDRFWAVFDELCLEVLEIAERIEELSSKREDQR